MFLKNSFTKTHLLKRFYTKSLLSNGISLIGAPICLGQKRLGVDKGPRFIKQLNLIDRIKSISSKIKITDSDDLNLTHQNKLINTNYSESQKFFAVGKSCEIIYQKVKKSMDENKFVITLGGDHSLGIGTGFAAIDHNPNTIIVWVDAHADIHIPSTSPSSNIHGMPVGFLLGHTKNTHIKGFDWIKKIPKLNYNKLIFLGLRDLEIEEKEVIRNNGIKTYSMRDVDDKGIIKVMNEIQKYVGDNPIHVAFDIDSIDKTLVPATGTPVNGGFTFREARYIAERFYEMGNMKSLDLVEVNPKLGENSFDAEKTAEIAISTICSFVGNRLC